MKALGHGANVAEMAERYNKREEDIIDFSSNINPFVAEGLESKVMVALSAARSYPDIHYTRLREQLANYLKCGKQQVIVGNGATEIMYLLMKAIAELHKEEQIAADEHIQELQKMRLGVMNPTFSEYERSARLNGLEIVNFYLEEVESKRREFVINLKAVKEQLEQIDALFVCNPNNPTGNVQDLKPLASLLKEKSIWLIVDETFMEFVDQDETYSLIGEIQSYPKLIVIKAITKFYGLPGIRLGYGVTSSKALLEKMYDYKEPWTVNSFAEQLTGTLLEDQAYQVKSKAYFKEERQRMLHALRGLKHLTVYDTDTNFILLKLHEMKAGELKEKLCREDNILIRDASNFKGLNDQFVRVAIKAAHENTQLLQALQRILY